MIMSKRKKKFLKSLVFFSCCLFFLGCSNNKSTISVQDYNNLILAYQIQAVDEVERYFLNLEKEYNGENLLNLYVQMRNQLSQLSLWLAGESDRKWDSRLKDAVAVYLSGLQAALQEYEMPIVEMLGSYTGSANQFYQEGKERVQKYSLAFSKLLPELDKKLEEQLIIFAYQYNYSLP